MSREHYQFSTRSGYAPAHNQDDDDLDKLREEVRDLTEKVRDLAEEMGGDPPDAPDDPKQNGARNAADLGYVSSAGAFNQLEADERRDGRSGGESAGKPTSNRESKSNTDMGYVEKSGAFGQMDDE